VAEPLDKRRDGGPKKNRRQAIVDSLKRCMVSKGYAETTLTDLAEAAGISVSHLLYYYPSKERVLIDLNDQVSARSSAGHTRHRDEPPEERIHILADNVFVRGTFQSGELGIVRQLTGLADHQPELKARITALSDQSLAYLEDLFSKTPRQPGLSAAEAAEIAAATWIGLINNNAYDARLDESRARRLFRKTLFYLANLDPNPAASVTAHAAQRRPRSRKPPPTGDI
jgi:AcrR family transcriptional regulator